MLTEARREISRENKHLFMKLVEISKGKNPGGVSDYRAGRNENGLSYNRMMGCYPS